MSLPPPPSHRLLAVLLATYADSSRGSDDLVDVQSALLSAVERGDSAALFLMSDGVRYALDPRLPPLIAVGVEISLCAMDAEAQGLDPAAISALGIELGSQHDHARLLRDAQPFLSWT